MNVKRSQKNNLGRHVFFALILGIITAQLVRMFITDPVMLDKIAEQFNVVTHLFLRLIQMIIAPVVFATLVVGISKLSDAKSLGRIFLKAFIIFLVGSILALAIGLIVVDFFEPGKQLGHHLIANQPAVKSVQAMTLSSNLTFKSFIEQVIPSSIIHSFANNYIIHIVVFSIFFGVAGVSIGKPVEPIFHFFELIHKLMFRVTDYVMLVAPAAVLSAVAAIIIKSGFGVLSLYLIYLAEFMICVILIWIAMIVIGYLILGNMVFQLLKVLANSLGIAFSTASSEAVLPSVIEQLEKLKVPPKISGFIMPLGYSFNLIASLLNCIFATMFIVQAHGHSLNIWQQLSLCLVLLVTSKGIAGIPRASLVIVAATLTTLGIPEAAVLILFPIDGFLDMFRSATNVFANALSATIIDKWER